MVPLSPLPLAPSPAYQANLSSPLGVARPAPVRRATFLRNTVEWSPAARARVCASHPGPGEAAQEDCEICGGRAPLGTGSRADLTPLAWLQSRADDDARAALRVVAAAGMKVPPPLDRPRALTESLYGAADTATCPGCGVGGPGDFCRSCGWM